MAAIRKLNSVETAKLYNFLAGNLEIAQTETAEELAKKAAEALGFAIVPANVNHLRKQMGINPRKSQSSEDLALSARVDEHKRALVLLAREICGLKTGLGSVCSAELTALSVALD